MEDIKSTMGQWEGQLQLSGGGNTCIDSSGETGIGMEAAGEEKKGMALDGAFPEKRESIQRSQRSKRLFTWLKLAYRQGTLIRQSTIRSHQ